MRQTHHLTRKREQRVADHLTVMNGSKQSPAISCLREPSARQKPQSLSSPVTQVNDLGKDFLIFSAEPRQIYFEGQSAISDLNHLHLRISYVKFLDRLAGDGETL